MKPHCFKASFYCDTFYKPEKQLNSTKIFQQWEYSVFRKKVSVFSGINLFCSQMGGEGGEDSNNKSSKETHHYSSIFYQQLVKILTQTF